MKTTEDCKSVPIIIPILGYVGLVLAIITGFITIFLFRNHSFNELDCLRR